MLLNLFRIKKYKNTAVAALVLLSLFIVCIPKVEKEIHEQGLAIATSVLAPKTDMDWYVPSISLLKSAPVFNGSDCDAIPITYRITNQGALGEDLQNIVITDLDFGGVVAGPNPGDFTGDNGNGILDAGETWTYSRNHVVTESDLENGQWGQNAANVNAELVSNTSIQVGDVSHPSDESADGPTIVDLTSCQNISIGLIKAWSYFDLDNDNCAENFLYDFTVRNTGNISLQNIVLDDPLMGGVIPFPTSGSDIGNDGILSPGEEWLYLALYSADLEEAGIIDNQATVTAETVNLGIQVADLSDDDSFFEDEITHAPYDNVCVGAFARIGLTKVASPLDVLGNGCNNAIEYTFTVQNVGDNSLENIVLSDDLLGGEITNRISNGNGDAFLDPGEAWVYQGQYVLTPADFVNGSVANQALVTAKLVSLDIPLFDYSDDNSFNENDLTIEPLGGYCGPAKIGLIKSVPLGGLLDLDNNGCNETISYTFTVANTGSADLGQVVLTDTDLNTPIIGPQGDVNNDQILSIGETWSYQAYYPITQSDINVGSVTNQATVTALDLNTNAVVSDFSDHTSFDEDRETFTPLSGTLCPAASQIGLIKRVPFGNFEDLDNDGCPETIRYFFDVENTGTIPLDNIVLTDPLLNGPVNGLVANTDVNGDNILSVGEQWTYEVLYPITPQDIANTEVINQAQVTADEWGTNTQVMDDSDDDSYDEDQPTVTSTLGACSAESGIGLLKTGLLVDLSGDGCFETVQYIFTVRNTGTVELDNVMLTDSKLTNGTITLDPSTDVNGDTILSVGEEWTYAASYDITETDITADEVRNQAQVSAQEVVSDIPVFDVSDPSDYNQDRETVIAPLDGACVPLAVISLNKFVGSDDFLDRNNDGCIETVRYNFTVSNTGTSDLDQVVLTDTKLGGQVVGTVPNSDVNGDEVLSVGETWTYQAFYPIKQSDIDAGFVSNQAQVTAFEQNTANEVFAVDEIVTTFALGTNLCPAVADIEIVKTGTLVNLDGDNCNESINYTFTVSNLGTIDLGQIVISDTYLTVPIFGPQGDTGNDQVLSLGETWTYETTYPITQTDIDAGTVTNQASVSAGEQITKIPVSASSAVISTDVTGACVAKAAIGLIKSADGNLVDIDDDGCPESINYTFTVKNTGAILLEQVVLNDIKMGPGAIVGPLPGNDINGDSRLSIGETWTYQALYPISEQDSIAGIVRNQAQVSAFEFGTMNPVADDSDDNSFDEDDETVTSVVGVCTAKAAIEIIKSGALVDLDLDDCPETIEYTFTVENTGAINLYQVSVTDTMLMNLTIEGPFPGDDINDDGILSIKEKWTYEAFYTLTVDDICCGTVTNQAQVSALEVPTNNPISNFSNEVVTPLIDVCVDPVNPVDPNFEIFNGITPNGDGLNDYFRINGIENYPDNALKVFNRWGVLVYEAKGYGLGNSFFTGHSQGRATIAKDRELPSGTYFYMLTFSGNNPGKANYSGYLYINRD